ncbi:hypothetical protein PsorP6_015200 [Peronosclerospora sorghi]|uniref:Uncharacterized protein n=1 Tax=Peronosclerospora sorghi TaxID=230839 RepID=A0ACC0VS54_9STRA|nr:hypothetical protein PsorP6_015200 [Peronosclerospora sorghi]
MRETTEAFGFKRVEHSLSRPSRASHFHELRLHVFARFRLYLLQEHFRHHTHIHTRIHPHLHAHFRQASPIFSLAHRQAFLRPSCTAPGLPHLHSHELFETRGRQCSTTVFHPFRGRTHRDAPSPPHGYKRLCPRLILVRQDLEFPCCVEIRRRPFVAHADDAQGRAHEAQGKDAAETRMAHPTACKYTSSSSFMSWSDIFGPTCAKSAFVMFRSSHTLDAMTMAQNTMRRHVARWSYKRPRVAARSRSTYTSVRMIHSAFILASVKMRFIKAASLRAEGGPAWSDKVNDDDDLDARGDTNTANGGTGGRDEAAARSGRRAGTQGSYPVVVIHGPSLLATSSDKPWGGGPPHEARKADATLGEHTVPRQYVRTGVSSYDESINYVSKVSTSYLSSMKFGNPEDYKVDLQRETPYLHAYGVWGHVTLPRDVHVVRTKSYR